MFEGEEAIGLGLADEMGSLAQVLHSRYPGAHIKSDYLMLPTKRGWL